MTEAQAERAARLPRILAIGLGETFAACALEGEIAADAGKPITANPFTAGDEDHDSWNFGWQGWTR